MACRFRQAVECHRHAHERAIERHIEQLLPVAAPLRLNTAIGQTGHLPDGIGKFCTSTSNRPESVFPNAIQRASGDTRAWVVMRRPSTTGRGARSVPVNGKSQICLGAIGCARNPLPPGSESSGIQGSSRMASACRCRSTTVCTSRCSLARRSSVHPPTTQERRRGLDRT